MSNNSSNTSNGIGFAGLLTIAFIVLKLLDKISWSWIWVFSPIWISASLAIVIFLIIVLISLFK